MDYFRIEGGRRLSGRVSVEGSKNAALPLMAAALLTDGTVTLRNVAELSDISNMCRLLRELGVEIVGADGALRLTSVDQNQVHARPHISANKERRISSFVSK